MSGTSATDILSGKAVLEGIGIRETRQTINAQPRGELVMPPSSDLPQPQQAAANRPADWPEDPDIKAAEIANQPRKEGITIAELANRFDLPIKVTSGIDPADENMEFTKGKKNRRLTREEMRESTRERIIAQQTRAASAAGGLDAPPTSHLAVAELDAEQAEAITREEVPESRFGRLFGGGGRGSTNRDEVDAFEPKSQL